MVDGLRDREMMRETFGKFVPESIADAILADQGTLRPQTRLTTTLFTDIVGFSTVSESMDPERLIATLNEYFEAVVKPIERNGGVIHQFQGDAILATYNLPVEDPEHAARAVQTALEIQEVIRARTFGEGVTLATRVGINTGDAVCGTVGAQGRLGFTVHGDHVNLAARIEQMNKELGTRILVAESTVELTGSRFEFRRVGELPIRGRRQSVVVYRLIGPHNSDETMPV
jgi:class 3 adenylate cyclase